MQYEIYTLNCYCRRSKRTFEPLMHVTSDGLVMTVPSVEVEVDCSIDTTAFPYDAEVRTRGNKNSINEPQHVIVNNNYMSYFAYACKTEGKNGISRLISALCLNCLISIPEYSRIIDYSIIWMCIWCGLLQKLYKIKKSELLNSKYILKCKRYISNNS